MRLELKEMEIERISPEERAWNGVARNGKEINIRIMIRIMRISGWDGGTGAGLGVRGGSARGGER